MSELIISNKEDLTNIADAVREQTGKTNQMSLNDIAEEIYGKSEKMIYITPNFEIDKLRRDNNGFFK